MKKMSSKEMDKMHENIESKEVKEKEKNMKKGSGKKKPC